MDNLELSKEFNRAYAACVKLWKVKVAAGLIDPNKCYEFTREEYSPYLEVE